MDTPDAREEFSRNPTVDDLIDLCRHLNEVGARYVIIGGFAVLHHGFIRATGDIDILIDSREENVSKIKEALLYLPDKAARGVTTSDVQKYTVIKVADEIVVDLLGSACGVRYDEIEDSIEYEMMEGVQIPYLNAHALLRTKQSLRPQDTQDRLFLERLIEEREEKKQGGS